MSDAATLSSQPQPKCAELTPCSVIAASFDEGYVKLQFAEQPAFSNHFGNIAGGFAVELIDVLISIAAYAKVRQ
jgi:acyl-coenzyme A thioesterase PaaI-like protein